jgi:hypothetical protein
MGARALVIGIAGVTAAAVVASMPEIKRYLKIRQM